MVRTPQRRGSEPTPQMGLFQQPEGGLPWTSTCSSRRRGSSRSPSASPRAKRSGSRTWTPATRSASSRRTSRAPRKPSPPGVEALAELQDKLYAQDKWAVLLIFQAMDAAGKDGAIKHVMSGVNPQGCQVFSFKAPSAEDLDHDYLWRCMKCLPDRGHIGIFNRSYYEETLVVRVHPEFLREAEAAARPGDQGHLEGTLPGHPQLRAVPGAQRRGRAQVLPPRLEEGAEAAIPGAHRKPGEELEVLRRATSPSAGTGTSTWRPTRT